MGTGANAALLRGASVLLLAGAMAVTAGEKVAAQGYSIALPDITNKRLSAVPETVRAGAMVKIRNAVWNVGAGALTPQHGARAEGPVITIRLVLVRNVKDRAGHEVGGWGFDSLKRHEVAWHTAVWEVPVTLAPGDWFLCADIDPKREVRESNELNNRTCLPLTIQPAPKAVAEDGQGEEPLPWPDSGEPADEEDEEVDETGPAGSEDSAVPEDSPEDGEEPGFSGPSGTPDGPEGP